MCPQRNACLSSNQNANPVVIHRSDAFLERATLQLVRCGKEVAAIAMDPSHKIIISGTGRAGTTFLVQLLTELGLDTGFTPDKIHRHIDRHSHGGLEWNLDGQQGRPTMRSFLRHPKHALVSMFSESKSTPYILKNPAFCDTLESVITEGRITIDHAYIPVRNLEAAALSRIRVGGTMGSTPGGIWKTNNPERQKAVLAEMFFGLIYTLALHDIPHTFLLFPRLTKDWSYTYQKLEFLVGGVGAETFRTAFTRTADPGLVHDFERTESAATARIREDPHPVIARSQRVGPVFA